MRSRLIEITSRYPSLRLGIVGDLCLDRYLEIDPEIQEISIETGLPVYNVINVRAQPGAAGTILLNLCALGVAEVYPVSFYGLDGEGFELEQALIRLPGVKFEGLIKTDQRRTFTYGKPLLLQRGGPPRELNRLDIKNWTPTPKALRLQLTERLENLWPRLDGIAVLEQAEQPETGVICPEILNKLQVLASKDQQKPILADSRRGLTGWPKFIYKMNRHELSKLAGQEVNNFKQAAYFAKKLSEQTGHRVFVTLAEEGLLGCGPNEQVYHMPALPVRGPIDIVGAGDAVTANLLTAIVAGASTAEALLLAGLAASIVIHQIGTTGSASVRQILELYEQYPQFVPQPVAI